jgi:hypothetical protein
LVSTLHVSLATKLNGQSFASVPPQKKITFKPDQLEAVTEIFLAFKEGYPGFLLADDIGLVRTFAPWASILKILESSAEKRKILIVCPSALWPTGSSIRWMGTSQCVEELTVLFVVIVDIQAKLFEGDFL